MRITNRHFCHNFIKNDEGDAVLINSNYAIDAGLNPLEDSIAMEESESPYVNIIAVREGDENNPADQSIGRSVEIKRNPRLYR